MSSLSTFSPTLLLGLSFLLINPRSSKLSHLPAYGTDIGLASLKFGLVIGVLSPEALLPFGPPPRPDKLPLATLGVRPFLDGRSGVAPNVEERFGGV